MPVKQLMQAVLVTGASTGIGQACAMYLHQQGFRVFAGVRSNADGNRLKDCSGGFIIPVHLDVALVHSIESAMAQMQSILGETGELHGLVNNAGIVVGGPLEYLPLEALREQLEVNVLGPVAVAQACLPMLRRAKGRIVNIGSIAGQSTVPLTGPYSASKHALEALTDAMRMELKSAGIHVAMVAPGSIATPIWEKSLARARALRETLPPEAEDHYGELMACMHQATLRSARRGISPLAVARTVHHALTARNPKTRYLVGWDARLRALANTLLPDTVIDWLVFRRIGYNP